jgi:hypothetical protein
MLMRRALVALAVALAACGGEDGGGTPGGMDAGPPLGEVGEGCADDDDCRRGLLCIEMTCARERFEGDGGWPTVDGTVPMGVVGPDAIAHACGLVTGCPISIAGVDVDFDGCFAAIDELSGRTVLLEEERMLLECLGAATDCAAARACTGATATACTASRCDGMTLYECPDGFEVPRDCAAHGGTCAPGEPDPEGKVEPSASCDYGVCTMSRCDGTLLFECDPALGFFYDPVDCGASGCTTDGCGTAGPPCEIDRCDASVIVVCDETGEQRSTDCSRLGGICRVDPDGFAECAFDRVACGADFASSCDGSVLHFCGRAVPARFDCASIGLTCTSGELGTSCAAPAS